MAEQRTAEQQQQTIFDDTLVRLMDRLEEFVDAYNVKDQEYLEFANDLMALKNMKTILTTTIVYERIERRVRRENPRPPIPSLAFKLESPEYTACSNCHSIVKKSYLKQHTKSGKCSVISQTKRTTHVSKKINCVAKDKILQPLNRALLIRKHPPQEVIDYYMGNNTLYTKVDGKWI
jgi:hypothetical protein